MVTPLFSDGTPSSKVTAQQQVQKLGLQNDPEAQRIARVMTAMLPWDLTKVRAFGKNALEASNELNEQVTRLVFQITQLNIDEYLLEVAKLMQPQEKSWIGKLMDHDVKFDINPVEDRLKALVANIDVFADALVRISQQSKESLERLCTMSKAAAMAVKVIEQEKPFPADIAMQRQQLLDMALTTATMTQTQIDVNQQNLGNWRQRIEQLLYVGIPNWRSVNGNPPKVSSKAPATTGPTDQQVLDYIFRDPIRQPQMKKPHTPGGALF